MPSPFPAAAIYVCVLWPEGAFLSPARVGVVPEVEIVGCCWELTLKRPPRLLFWWAEFT